MLWFLISLVPPLLYALTNHTDKYLLSKYFDDKGIGSLIIFSGLFSILALPVIYWFDPQALAVAPLWMALLALSGALTVVSILCYLYALQSDEATVIVPFYQTIPIFTYLLGFVFLGESLLANQVFGGALIFIGAFALSLNLEGGKWSFRKRVALLMILASLLYAVNSVVFKFFALDLGFWPSLFWDSVGKVLMGVAFFLLVRNYRRDFVATIKQNKASVFLLNSTSETLTILADSISGYAILLAPIALVSVVLSGFQPVFVFLIGIILTLLLPRLGKETLTKRSLVQRIGALVLILVGTYFLG